MRGSGWIPAVVATLLCVAACIWPAAAFLIDAGGALANETADIGTASASGLLLLRTCVWSAVIATAAMLLGWWPGRLIGGSVGMGRFIWLAMALAVPVCLPAYVTFWCWWQAWPPGSALHEWAARHDMVPQIRQATLLLALACWAWPIVAWCVAGCLQNAPAHAQDLMRMSGMRWWRRAMIHLRYDSRGLALGGGLVALLVFGNTVCFDLASVFTIGNELRAQEALGASAGALLRTAMPSIAVMVLVAAVVWLTLNAPAEQRGQRPSTAPARGPAIYTALLWIASLALPCALLTVNMRSMLAQRGWSPVQQFADYYGGGAVNTLGVAAVSGVLASLIALGLTMMWLDGRRAVRMAAHVQAVLWIMAGAIPATIAAMALEAAFNQPGPLASLVYATPVALLLGLTGRFAFIGVLIGRWLAMREPADLRDLRLQDDACNLPRFLRATWPRLLPASVAGFAIAAVLAAGEITVSNGLRPGGFDVLAPSVLNAMHYQQVDIVLIAVMAQLGLALLAAGALIVILRRSAVRRRVGVAAMLCLSAILLAGCSRDDGTPRPLDTEFVFGAPGQSLGQFDYPRGIAVDSSGKSVYVVDKSARVQRFTLDGKPEVAWRMPAKDNGKPTGLNVAPDGRVFVADTHYYRVIAYDRDGHELMRFGSYGEDAGQFIYPTEIEFGADGRLYVAEYGGNDRIQVFDAHGEHLFSFGSFGSEPGQFNRPQSMVFDADRQQLYVADACNHRIQIFAADGTLVGGFGELGREPGQLSYPYDLTMLADGTLLVCEFGNHRVQHFAVDGRPLGIMGRLGAERGELKYPWGVDTDGRHAFVLDSGNNRVQVIDLP